MKRSHAHFTEEQLEAERGYEENRERYDTVLRLMKGADSWEELSHVLAVAIPSRLDFELDDPLEWVVNLLFPAFQSLESDLRRAAENVSRASPLRRHQLEREMIVLQLALRKLREVLKTVPTKEATLAARA